MTEVQTNAIEARAKQGQPAGSLRTHLIKGATGSFVLQVGFAGFSFLNAIILARVLGAGGYGSFANAMAWVSLLTIPATFGFGILLVRDTAIYRSQGKWALLKGLLRFSNRIVLVLSVVLALVAAVVSDFLFSSPDQAMMRHTIWIALGLLPLFALYNLREAATRGLEHVIYARFPGMIVRPELLLAGIVSIYYFFPKQLSAATAMAVNVGSGGVTLALGIVFLRKLLPSEVKAAMPEYMPRPWLKSAFPMLVYGGAQIVLRQTDIVMLGAMRGAYEVGLYAAANRLAFLLVYGTASVEMILAPMMSRMYVDDKIEKLQKLTTKGVNIGFFVLFPFGLMLIFSGNYVLSVFGHDFIAAGGALIILATGRLLDVALGSSAVLLSMTGHENKVSMIFVLITIINITLNALLIPIYSMEGAAIASAVSLVTAKLWLTGFAYKKTGICTTILFNAFSAKHTET